MMGETAVLAVTAAAVGAVHTVLGPDHYLPFVVLAKARGWSVCRTVIITLLCGIAHVLSSVAIGFAGIMLGSAVVTLERYSHALAGLAIFACGGTVKLFGL